MSKTRIYTCSKEASDLEIYCDGELQEIDIKGDLIQWWPGGFYETGFNLLFSDETLSRNQRESTIT